MKTHTFFVENIKCNGCAETIRKSALKFSGVQKVVVYRTNLKFPLN
jgi:copper chaperone CopZ